MAVRLNVVQDYLEQQRDLTAVQRFSRQHSAGETAHSGVYESLIPLSRPKPGEQYGFQVDLDACTGCKACVVGCNKMNGLDKDEAWRMVGLIHGGPEHAPIQQTITTACHHCLDPACANGCPVSAYEKDPETGIVKHLDDQCIGCQYCTLTCPYEVPQFNKRLGIVRKCDMCSDRLSAGEAPACVQSCPNEAISIRIVERHEVLADAQGGAFLPGAPSPAITAPTTTFKTKRALPRNALPANFYNVRPADKHLPLVVMLVLTQLSVGAFCVDALWNFGERSVLAKALGQSHSLVALGLGLLALGAAVFHLGRPLYAFRAFIGLRRSWMSREIIAFGAFVKVALLYALCFWKPAIFHVLGIPTAFGVTEAELQHALSLGVASVGLFAVVCSVMIYRATNRMWWNGTTTGLKFLGTSAVLGVATMLLTTAVTGLFAGEDFGDATRLLLVWLSALSGAKLAYETGIFLHLFDKQQGDLKRTALLMKGELKRFTFWRYATGIAGGLALPQMLLFYRPSSDSSGAVVVVALLFVLVVLGEMLERVLFFTAVSAPRMPGAVGK